MNLNFFPIFDQLPYLLGGAWISLQLAVLAFAFGMVIAMICTSTLHYGPKLAGKCINAYVVFATNTPQLVQIYFLFFALPEVGILLSPFTAVLIGATFNAGAYLCEIQRAGFDSVRRMEIEAAEVLGFSRVQIIRYVILPHVIKVMFRPLSNQFIVMTLGTSMASMFGVEELTGRTYNLSSQTYLSVESFSVTAVIYIAITIVATFALAIMGRFLFRARTGGF